VSPQVSVQETVIVPLRLHYGCITAAGGRELWSPGKSDTDHPVLWRDSDRICPGCGL